MRLSQRYKEARLAALKADEVYFEGPRCSNDRTTKKYSNSGRCVACINRQRKEAYHRSERGKQSKKNHEQAEYERLHSWIAHHKANPQLSCQRW